MAKFRKRTESDLASFEPAQVTLEQCARDYYVQWVKEERFSDWRDLPGGLCDVYVINAADLRAVPEEIEADDWHHLCSIVGLKEALAHVFFVCVLEPVDFDIAWLLSKTTNLSQGNALELAAAIASAHDINHFALNGKLGKLNRAKKPIEHKPYHMPICKSPAGAGNDHPECTC